MERSAGEIEVAVLYPTFASVVLRSQGRVACSCRTRRGRLLPEHGEQCVGQGINKRGASAGRWRSLHTDVNCLLARLLFTFHCSIGTLFYNHDVSTW
jgi:hypothetical protein